MITAIFLAILISGFQSEPPDTLTLEYCHDLIENKYPLAHQLEFQDEIADLNKKIANTTYYPQLNFGAQATYQSEVTDLPIPSTPQFSAPELSKDQYRVNVEASQLIYNGGAVAIRKELAAIRGKQQNNATKVELHQIIEQVNQVYFGILLAQQQLQVISTLMENLKVQIKEVTSKVANGVLLPSQQFTLEAELVNIRQDSAQIRSNIASGYKMLSDLLDEPIRSQTKLSVPKVEIRNGKLPKLRPEFDLFESNRQVLHYQKELAETKNVPSFSAFGNVAYGRPGYDVFDDDLHAFYMVGLRLQWNFWDAINVEKKKQIYQLQQKIVREEERAFERQLWAVLNKTKEQIRLIEEQLERDREIVELREKVVEEKESQMKNGTITATEYITELTKVTQARLSEKINRTRLAQSKVVYQTALGIPENR